MLFLRKIFYNFLILFPLFLFSQQKNDPYGQLIWEAQLTAKLEESIDILNQAKKLNPEEPEAYWIAGRLYYYKGFFENAGEEFLQCVLKTEMQNRSYYVGRVQALTFRFKKQNTGKLYLESLKKSSLKDYSAAISILYKAIRQEPGNARLYLELGNVFSRMKDWRYAIYNLEKARTINPVHHEILGELKYLYMETENIENLKKVVADIEAVFGKSPYFHYEIGFTYMKKEQMEEAEQVFLGIIRNYPDFPLSYFRLGQIALFRKEAPQKAKEYLDQFIKLVRQGKYSEILKRIPADLFMEKAREWLKMIHNKQNPPLTR